MPVINGTGNEDFPHAHSVADVIFEFGDDAALLGLWGEDTLPGSSGTDSLGGGEYGLNVLDEALRTDPVTDFGSLGDLSMPLATGLPVDDAAGDLPTSLASVVGTSLADLLVGNGFANLRSRDIRLDLLTGSHGAASSPRRAARRARPLSGSSTKRAAASFATTRPARASAASPSSFSLQERESSPRPAS